MSTATVPRAAPVTPAIGPPALDALAPVRLALLRRARADADACLAAAARDAARILRDARDEADRILAEARDIGAADAAVLAETERAHAERAARGILLAARRAVHDELRRRAVAAVAAQAHRDPVRAALTASVEAALGPGARLTPTPDGGVLGTVDGRRVDGSVQALVDHVMAGLPDPIAAVWS